MEEDKKMFKKTTNNKTKKSPKANSCITEKHALDMAESRISKMTTGEDLRTAILIVSVTINLFFLIAWILLQVTDIYDGAVASALFDRTLIR